MEECCWLLPAKESDPFACLKKIYPCCFIMTIHHCATIKLNFLENLFAKGQLKSWYDFFFGIRKLYAYASLVITSYYDQVLMKSTGVYKSPVQRGNKGLWSFFVLVICQNPGVLPYTKEL